MTATVPDVATKPAKSRKVQRLYDRLAANKAKLTKAECYRDRVAAERAVIWEALLAAEETQVEIALASGVHKTYIRKELERRANRGTAGATS